MLFDYQTKVIGLLQDDAAKITPAQRDEAIVAAVLRYSADRPNRKVEDITGASGQLVALPAAWEAGFSELRTLEYPVGNVPPTLIESDLWRLYDQPAGQVIQLTNGVPAGSTLRALYTIRHLVTDAADTIPTGDRDAVAKLAASYLCGILATFYANDTDSSIQADRVAQTSRSQAFRTRERDYRREYTDALGVDDKQASAGGTVVQLNRAGRRGTFFHQLPPEAAPR